MITYFCTRLHCPESCTDPSLMIPEWEESVLGQPVCPAGTRDKNGYNTALQKTSPHLEGLEVSGYQHPHGTTWLSFPIPPATALRSWQMEWTGYLHPYHLGKRSLQRMMSKHLDKTQLNIRLKLEHLLELTMRERKMFHLFYAWIKITRK